MIHKKKLCHLRFLFVLPVSVPYSSYLTGFFVKGGDCMLTIKQEKFCLEYAECGNARQAYIKAGYSHTKDSTVDVNACRLLKNDKVQARLAELAEEVKNNSIANIQEMQEKLTQIIRQETTEDVIVTEFIGDGCSEARLQEKKPAVKDVISAINTLGKMQGLFKDKIEVEAIIPVFAGEDELED